jgi:hypothetical protein
MLFTTADGGLMPPLWEIGRRVWRLTRRAGPGLLMTRGAMRIAQLGGLIHGLGDRRGTRSNAASVVRRYALDQLLWPTAARRLALRSEVRAVVAESRPEGFVESLFAPDQDGLQQLPRVRALSFLPYNAIPYVERNTAPHGLSPVFPFLEPVLFEYLLRVPYQFTYGRGYRFLMKRAFGGKRLPNEVFRRDVRGFNPPVDAWMGIPLGREIVGGYLGTSAARTRDVLDWDYVTTLRARFDRGGADADLPAAAGHSPGMTLWVLLALEVWLRQVLVPNTG